MKEIAPGSIKTKSSQSSRITADSFADFFSQIGKSNKPQAEFSSDRPAATAASRNTAMHFELSPCTENDILKIINKIPVNKADGIDGIPIKCLRLGVDALLTPITLLVNLFIK